MTRRSPAWRKTITELTTELIRTPSVSPDQAAENNCAAVISQQLEQRGFGIQIWETPDGRYNVASFLRGQHAANSGETLILLSHYDTVGVSEFVGLDPALGEAIAFAPDRLRATLLNREDTPAEVRAAAAEADGDGPVWLFGRGGVDMKGGVAINIAMMEHIASWQDELAGNILFLSCPDEEIASAGIKGAIPRLKALAAQENLTYVGVINTDYSTQLNRDENGRSVYAGTIGKLLPSLYMVGVPSHVGDPYRGLDANVLLAELIREFHLNAELIDRQSVSLADQSLGEQAAPPVVLKASDLKAVYNVQTAAEGHINLNWLTLAITPRDALGTLQDRVFAVLTRVLVDYRQRAEAAGFSVNLGAGTVLTYADLVARVATVRGERTESFAFQTYLGDLKRDIRAQGGDERQQSLNIIRHLTRQADLTPPTVILYYAPPYYPSVSPTPSGLLDAIQATLDLPEFNEVNLRGYFPLISDLSFIVRPEGQVVQAWQQQSPLPEEATFDGLDGVPVVNIGTWGFDAHGLYERVHTPYSFDIVPRLIATVIKRMVGGEK